MTVHGLAKLTFTQVRLEMRVFPHLPHDGYAALIKSALFKYFFQAEVSRVVTLKSGSSQVQATVFGSPSLA